MSPAAPFEDRARHLRALYRRHHPTQWVNERGFLQIDPAELVVQWRIVKAEYRRLFPDGDVEIDNILVNAWIEARELAGWRYDVDGQGWLRADGQVAREADDREWRDL